MSSRKGIQKFLGFLSTAISRIWLGGTLHAAGANQSNEWRYGIILSYSLGWLRQEENQYLNLPPALAKNMPNEVRELVGYPMHGSLGFYDRDIAKI